MEEKVYGGRLDPPTRSRRVNAIIWVCLLLHQQYIVLSKQEVLPRKSIFIRDQRYREISDRHSDVVLVYSLKHDFAINCNMI